MTLVDAYEPPRDITSKLRRRMTQVRAARPAHLSFDTPMLSICFDDFPRSASFEGARILENFGARATFYASASLAQVDGPCGPGFEPDDMRRVAAGGHEIGCHTYAHRDCARIEAQEMLSDLEQNREALARMGHVGTLEALAYPYGEVSIALKRALPRRFNSARGIGRGLNLGRVDLAQLRAYPLFGDDYQRAMTMLDVAARRRAWMIAFTHDVADQPSPWGTSEGQLHAFLGKARGLGFAIAPVSAALARAKG